MNSSKSTDFSANISESDFDFKKEFFKYFYYWKFFLISTTIFLVVAYTYLRYTAKVFHSSAKIQVVDKKEASLELPSASEIFSKSKINLENEIEVLKSYPILKRVVKNRNLQTSVYAIGNLIEGLRAEYPFDIKLKVPVDSLLKQTYRLNLTDNGFEIIDLGSEGKSYSFKGNSTIYHNHKLPFEIFNFDMKKYIKNSNEGYEIRFSFLKDVISSIKKSLEISQVGRESDIIELNFRSTDIRFSESVLNELIDVFNEDGVKDRQLIHKRTIDFVNARYAYLSQELDSIEIAKQLYKVDNKLVNLSANTAISLEKSFKSEEGLFNLENQISITNLLINTLTNKRLDLLPANMVLENNEINKLIGEYNEIILKRKKLVFSAGANNPTTKQLDNTIFDFRSNIIYSLQNHLSQLKNMKNKLSNQFYNFNNDVSNLPEKEKILRAIERNQKIKESLYLFLLQKREEAEVSYAVTEPSIKIVEYAISEGNPISPKAKIIYLSSVLFGLLLPFGVIYLMFFFNNKIYSKNQIEDLKLPTQIIGEIPEIESQPNTTIISAKERSPLAESFRVLYSKLKYFGVDAGKDGHVTMVTSVIKGEGKTFCAINIAYTKSSLGKKVLLIGADLHNPQIHTYLNIEKESSGLVNYLVDEKFDWKKALFKPDSVNCDVLIGGQIPPNPAQLLNNGNFENLINEAKNIYDHIIIDTPPCLLVSDTLTINSHADILLFVVRCNYTDINLLKFIEDSHEKGIIQNNSMIILNGLGASNKYGYGYAYNYSYVYKYKYSYNYGYGYEYQSEE